MKRKMRNKIFGAVLVVLALAGCSSISSGHVVGKEIEPSRQYTVMQYCGKGCLIPVTHYDDEDYRLDLQDGEDSGSVYVSPETYEKYQVGDYFNPPKEY